VAINGQNMRSGLANQYGVLAAFAALYSTVPGASAGTELTGGSPAYARKAPVWAGAGATNTNSFPGVTFDVASGSTVAGAGFHSARDGRQLHGRRLADLAGVQLTGSVPALGLVHAELG
jgi:hypothetical protein